MIQLRSQGFLSLPINLDGRDLSKKKFKILLQFYVSLATKSINNENIKFTIARKIEDVGTRIGTRIWDLGQPRSQGFLPFLICKTTQSV